MPPTVARPLVIAAPLVGVMACALGASGAPGESGIKPAAPSSAPASAPKPAAAHGPSPAVPFPHPLITEVLYAVPPGIDGDASRDGVRQVAGDEFIELVNPHDKPIQLLGYTLVDESQGDKSKVRFTFPALELAPGAVVVVFNGFSTSWKIPVGDAGGAAQPAESFAGARVFTMRITSPRTAFNNTGDSVTLLTPAAKPVQIVRWGTSAAPKLADAGVLDETVPEATTASVQRLGVTVGDAWLSHTAFAGETFSPGRYTLDTPPTNKQPAQPPSTKPQDRPEPPKKK